jgi:type IV secretion system protein VirB10
VSPPTTSTDETSDRDQQHKQGLAAQKLDPKIYVTGLFQQPSSPYELMAGAVIAAALVPGINSDLPDQTIATVAQNVYDTVTANA